MLGQVIWGLAFNRLKFPLFTNLPVTPRLQCAADSRRRACRRIRKIDMGALQELRDIATDPKAYVKEWKQKTGGKVVGTLCSYAPEELILAGGALAFRIVGGSGAISRADAHLQAYSCSLVRGALEEALDGRFDFLDGVIFPHTCDTIQRLSDIWRMNANTGFHLDVVLPVKLNTDSARQYMAEVLTNARAELEDRLGKTIADADIRKAIDVYNGIRSIMQRLYGLRAEKPAVIPGSDVHAIVRASMVMDRREFLEKITKAVDALEQKDFNASVEKRLFLSGGVCNLPDLYGSIEASGGVVVGDDLCSGSRGLTGLIDTGENPITDIAERYAQRAICPAKHAGVTLRGEELVQQAKAHRADGVIFVFLKFCDPHAFDYPYLKAMLEQAGIPSLLVELEDQSIPQGQFQTRCEAFIEML
jgi:bzd-type benzoyl-CoA reductase N subunit